MYILQRTIIVELINNNNTVMINFGSRPFSNQTQIKENKINNTNISLINVKRQKQRKRK